MSREGRDIRAAEDVFLELFQAEDKKAQKKLARIFLKAFLKKYKAYKGHLENFSKDGLSTQVQNMLTEAAAYVHWTDGKSPEGKAEVYGTTLGCFLSALEYGLPNPRCKLDKKETMATVVSLAENLKKRDITIRTSFIKRRVQQIAKRNSGKLTDNKKKLIASIAAAFA